MQLDLVRKDLANVHLRLGMTARISCLVQADETELLASFVLTHFTTDSFAVSRGHHDSRRKASHKP